MYDDPQNAHYAAMAGIGGGLGYLYRALKDNTKIRVGMVVLSCALAAFIGYHMVFIYDEFNLSNNLKGALNGLSALLGVEFMLYFFRKVALKFIKVVPEKDIYEQLIKDGWSHPSHTLDNSDRVDSSNVLSNGEPFKSEPRA